VSAPNAIGGGYKRRSGMLGRAIAADSPDDFRVPRRTRRPAGAVAGVDGRGDQLSQVVDPVRSDGLMRTLRTRQQVWTVRGLRAFRAAYPNSSRLLPLNELAQDL